MNKEYLKAVELRFLRFTTKSDGCWEWTGYKDKFGYGKLTLMDGRYSQGASWSAHCVSALLYLGFDREAGLQVNHACGHSGCVNPAHLYVGTHRENMDDAIRMGEQSRGEKHGMATASDDDVAWARAQYASGEMTQTAIGKVLGVTQECVGYWVRGEFRQ